MKIKPFYDKVLVKRDEAESVTKGGIVIVDTGKEAPAKGIVKAVGFGQYIDGELKPLHAKVGAKVIFGKYAGTEVDVNGEKLLLMRESDILGELT